MSINQLDFCHNAFGIFQGIGKSDGKELYVWDLRYEQYWIVEGGSGGNRPKRPDYMDAVFIDSTICVCGPYAFAYKSLTGMHNLTNIICLDAGDLSSHYNYTELDMPLMDAKGGEMSAPGPWDIEEGRCYFVFECTKKLIILQILFDWNYWLRGRCMREIW